MISPTIIMTTALVRTLSPFFHVTFIQSNDHSDVTIYQRSSTYIMTTKNGWEVNFKGRPRKPHVFFLYLLTIS